MKAMELVAGSKMRKTTQQTLAARPFHLLLEQMRERVEQESHHAHELLRGRPGPKSGRSLLVIAASDRGLCAGFNNQLIKYSLEFLRTHETERFDLLTIGRRAEAVARRSGNELVASFPAISNAPSFARAKPIVEYIRDAFLSGRVDRIFFAYTHFKSALVQQPTIIQLLPISNEQLAKDDQTEEEQPSRTGFYSRYFKSEPESDSTMIFEPTSDAILEALLPRLVETRVYTALLESASSEHSARMMAMRSAGDAAAEMADDLTFTLNQARQSAITREISEISAGKAAIE